MMQLPTRGSAISLPERVGRMFRFGCVGAIVFGLDLGLVFVLGKFLPALVAVTIAYFLAVCANFCLNKWWVFRAANRRLFQEVLAYCFTAFLCWCCTIACVKAALAWLTHDLLWAKVAAVPPTMALGFCLMRWVVFQPTSQGEKKST